MRDSESKHNKFVLVLSVALSALLFTGASYAERTIQTPVVVGASEVGGGAVPAPADRPKKTSQH